MCCMLEKKKMVILDLSYDLPRIDIDKLDMYYSNDDRELIVVINGQEHKIFMTPEKVKFCISALDLYLGINILVSKMKGYDIDKINRFLEVYSLLNRKPDIVFNIKGESENQYCYLEFNSGDVKKSKFILHKMYSKDSILTYDDFVKQFVETNKISNIEIRKED